MFRRQFCLYICRYYKHRLAVLYSELQTQNDKMSSYLVFYTVLAWVHWQLVSLTPVSIQLRVPLLPDSSMKEKMVHIDVFTAMSGVSRFCENEYPWRYAATYKSTKFIVECWTMHISLLFPGRHKNGSLLPTTLSLLLASILMSATIYTVHHMLYYLVYSDALCQ